MNNTVLKTNRNTYFVKFGINAHCEAEEILGFPITQITEERAGMLTFRTLLSVGLKYAGNPVSMVKAGEIMEEIIEDKGIEYFSEQISAAIEKSLNQQNNQNFKQNQGKKKY
jgi:4-aminobutyrate aminotransferase-like enzyme